MMTMGSISKLCERMRWYCDEANIGYDQSNRWDIRVGGESDRSSLTIQALRDAGFDTGNASYTGNMSDELTARGWKRLPADISTCRPGDILLNDTHHVCVVIAGNGWNATIAQASIDENGRVSGGQSGDQTGTETVTKPVYNYRHGWDCILRWGGGSDVKPANNTGGGKLDVDGWGGYNTVLDMQHALGTYEDGVISGQWSGNREYLSAMTSVEWDADGSPMVAALQRLIGAEADGLWGKETSTKLQKRLISKGYNDSPADGYFGNCSVRALQKCLNDGKLV